MKKILVSAYAISPKRGSECAVGWEITKRLGQYFDVTVLMCTQTPSGDNYAHEVEKYIEEFGSIKNVKFTFVSMPRRSNIYTKIHDIGFWPAYYWGYKTWQKKAFKIAKELHIINNYDLVYQLNMIGFREPSYLWKLPIPFVWGPTNGFHSIPFSFLKAFKGKNFVFQCLKHIFNEIQIRTATRPKKAAKKSKIVWCVDRVTQRNLSNWGAKTELLQETGLIALNSSSNDTKTKFDNQRVLKIVWSGMVTPGKALNILIDALIINKDLNFKLIVLGDGPLLEEMKIKAKPINHKIDWLGMLTKEEAINHVKSSDLLAHTSLKEGTTNVILEAIGHGVPVICHDTCGMGIVINDKNGFKIPYKDFDTSVLFISQLLKSIFENPRILNNKFDTIKQTTSELTWDNKVKHISQKINEIIIENKANMGTTYLQKKQST